ncbi:MAG TPA: hypothetical protein VGI93_20925 [Steroidobacteraceae bacterium]|jgi:uncharacterized iron-regulated membrane protein
MSPITLRRWHSYLSLLAAPSVLFFTFTGALQLFSWHEAHGTYQPPAWLEKMSSVHKDQVMDKHDEDKPETGKAPAEEPKHEEEPLAPATVALKAYFFWVGAMLIVSTCFGAWMGLTQTPRKRVAWSLLIVGTALPLCILLL